jgi:hypothetical protein
MSRPVCIYAGYLVRYPLAGQVMSQVHYLAGLRRLGYDVVFVEHHGWAKACYDPRSHEMTDDPSYGIAELKRVFARFGLGRWCYVDAAGQYHGLSREELRRLCREAQFLFSVASTTWLEEFYECRTRVYVDGDPGFTQLRMPKTPTPSSAGYASPWDFQFHFTAGERIGQPDCPIPTVAFHWRPTRIPVVLDLMVPRYTPEAKLFTTVMSWSAYGTIEVNGVTYGQKDVELVKLLDLPQRAGAVFELALAAPESAIRMLRDAGWVVSHALDATIDVPTYLDFIGGSRGEFSVAKNAYVRTRCGSFYERSSNYLAMGKPVIIQDTGFSEIIPCGEGLFAFNTADDVVAAVEAVNADYPRHCRAARRVAEEYFASDIVVGQLLQECGLSPS